LCNFVDNGKSRWSVHARQIGFRFGVDGNAVGMHTLTTRFEQGASRVLDAVFTAIIIIIIRLAIG